MCVCVRKSVSVCVTETIVPGRVLTYQGHQRWQCAPRDHWAVLGEAARAERQRRSAGRNTACLPGSPPPRTGTDYCPNSPGERGDREKESEGTGRRRDREGGGRERDSG